MKTKIIILSLAMLGLLGLDACKKCCYDERNPECENYDACYNKTNADFQISIYNTFMSFDGGYELLYDGDTINFFNTLTLTPLHKADSFYWRLGSDPLIRRNEVLEIGFGTPVGKVDIHLVVFRNTTSAACSEDVGRDSVTKTVYMHYFYDAPFVNHTYRGSFNTAPYDLFDVKVIAKIDTWSGGLIVGQYFFENYPPVCLGVANASIDGQGVRNFYFDGPQTLVWPCMNYSCFVMPHFKYVRFSKDYNTLDVFSNICRDSLRQPTDENEIYFKGTKIN